jgi:arylsulfatase A-like enzyme
MFMRKLLFLLCLFPFFLKAQKPPNVIIFFADDLRASALGCYGNPYVKTPTIDSLAARGMRFTNTYIQGSHHGALCAPSRAMLLTGKSYHRIKDKMAGHETIAKRLKDRGYETYMTGKWHNEKQVVAESFSKARNVMFGGMSDHYQVYCQDLLPDGQFTDIEYKGFSTDIFGQTMMDFIDEHPKDKPFFMYLPFTAPHDPRSPLPEYAKMYNPAGMPLPPNFMPSHTFYFGHSMEVRDENLAPYPRTPEVMRAQWAEYAGLITHMDETIGKVIAKLKAENLTDNTLIIFLSDNGLAMGSHGLIGKQSAYEHCMNVPMIFSGPGIPQGTESDAFLYTLDILPTIADKLGIEKPDDLDGVSFEASFRHPETSYRESIFTSYMNHQRAIRVVDYKLIRYPYIDKTVLFNLKEDPFELNDLSNRPGSADKISELMTEMRNQQEKYGDHAPLVVEETVSEDWDYRTIDRKPDQWQPQEVIDKYFKD